MIIDLTNFPSPFESYSKEYDITPEILEKAYRTGYLWREYDIEELLEYIHILAGIKLEKRIVKRFIRHSDTNEYILTLMKGGMKECDIEQLKDKSYIKRLVKDKI